MYLEWWKIILLMALAGLLIFTIYNGVTDLRKQDEDFKRLWNRDNDDLP